MLRLTPHFSFRFVAQDKLFNPIFFRAFLIALSFHLAAYIVIKVQPLLFLETKTLHPPIIVETQFDSTPETLLSPHQESDFLPPPSLPSVRGLTPSPLPPVHS